MTGAPDGPTDRPRLTVVLPAYQEAERIGGSLQRLRDELTALVAPDPLEIIVVDDGSTDGTAAAAATGADQVLVHPVNRGKGAAVRTGMRAAHGATVVFTDADLAYAPGDVLAALRAVEAGADVAVGSRRHADTRTVVEASRLRTIGGRVINRSTRLVLQGRYGDTQSGLKGFEAGAAQRIFAHTRIDRFAFDVEVLFLVERYGLTLTEVPVQVTNSSRSTVHVVRDGLRLVADLARIRWLAWRGAYEEAPSATSGAARAPD